MEYLEAEGSEVIYISGPMSSIADNNFPAFREAAKVLRDQGHRVVSPHELHMYSEIENGWAYYVRRDLLILLERCDSIAMLPGWSLSKGAMLEHHVAFELGFKVYQFINGELVD